MTKELVTTSSELSQLIRVSEGNFRNCKYILNKFEDGVNSFSSSIMGITKLLTKVRARSHREGAPI